MQKNNEGGRWLVLTGSLGNLTIESGLVNGTLREGEAPAEPVGSPAIPAGGSLTLPMGRLRAYPDSIE